MNGDDRPEWRKLLRRVTRRVGGRVSAEDCLQSAYVRMTERRATTVVQDPAAYLTRTAVNIAIDYSRQLLVHTEVEGELARLFTGAADPLQDEVLIARERLARVREGLTRLPTKTRLIFLSHRLDGKTYREIAEEHGISVSAVEKHVAKAMIFITKWAADW